MRRVVTILAASLIALLVVGYGTASALVWDTLTRVNGECHPEWADNDPTHFSYPGLDTSGYLMPTPQDVRFPSREAGIEISGWWLPADDPAAPAIVVVHGHSACKRDHDVLLPAGMLYRNGFSVLLIDLRDHGESTDEDGRFAGGTEEYRDVLGAWDWLQTKEGIPADRIGLVGISLGAATVLIAAGEEPRVSATWEDSSYADIAVAIDAELARNGYPGFLEPGGVLMARLISGDDLRSRSPLDAVRKMTGRDLYITHGAADERLSVRYASTLTAAARDSDVRVTTWIVPAAGHTKAMGLVPDAYERRLIGFFQGALATGGLPD
ncbi:MAG TPA: alpha/beta fold hydrolase [Candidatus Limnocylindrales bacterium]|nr:alpha/beta fold hydrolase [Candidatus Limnocylindrales bacterium]